MTDVLPRAAASAPAHSHAPSATHDHPHEPAHAHLHGHPPRLAALPAGPHAEAPAFSLLRVGLGPRLALAAGLSALIWLAVLLVVMGPA
jgi:hypothetical protein